MAKFKIGDKIKAKENSNGKYAEIVSLEYGRVGLKFFNCDGLNTSWEYSTDVIEKV